MRTQSTRLSQDHPGVALPQPEAGGTDDQSRGHDRAVRISPATLDGDAGQALRAAQVDGQWPGRALPLSIRRERSRGRFSSYAGTRSVSRRGRVVCQTRDRAVQVRDLWPLRGSQSSQRGLLGNGLSKFLGLLLVLQQTEEKEEEEEEHVPWPAVVCRQRAVLVTHEPGFVDAPIPAAVGWQFGIRDGGRVPLATNQIRQYFKSCLKNPFSNVHIKYSYTTGIPE